MRKYLLDYFLCTCLMIFLLSETTFSQISKAERLESLLKLSKTDSSRVNILNALYKEYLAEFPLKAKGYAERALKLAEKIDYTTGIIKSLDYIADIYHKEDAYGKAIEFYTRALQLKEIQKDMRGIADSYNKLGNAYALQEDVTRAIEYYNKALEIWEKLGDLKGITRIYTNLGGAYYRTKKYEESINYHGKALALADSLHDDQIRIYNYSRLGETYFRQKKFKESLKWYRLQLILGDNIGKEQEKQKAYEGLSQVYAAQGNFKKAYEAYQLYVDVKEDLVAIKTKGILDEIEAAKQQLIIADQQRKLQEAESENQRIVIFAVLFFSVLLIAIVVILTRYNRRAQKTNKLLEQRKQQIEQSNEKLEITNKKLEDQKARIEKQNATLEATFKEIERKNKDITSSINYASRIQEAMLPRQNKILEALPDHFILYSPRDIVSGDFYWFSEVNGKIIIAAIDCTGHGVPGAIMSMLGDSYLNQIINLQKILEPSTILAELHKNIGVALNQEETNNQDGMDVALCIIDKKQKTLEFAGASRILMLVQDGEHKEMVSCNLPIGGFQRDRERIFTKHTFDISKPTWFYIFSDGFQDQFGGPRGRKFAKKRLFNALFENHDKPMQVQKVLLEKTLQNWMGQNRQMDDIMVIGVKL